MNTLKPTRWVTAASAIAGSTILLSGCILEEPVLLPPIESESVSITYPYLPEVMTLDDSITVYGTSSNASIQAVFAGEYPATTDDDFATWQITLPVTTNSNQTFELQYRDSAGNVKDIDDSITVKQRSSLILEPDSVVYDSANHRLMMRDLRYADWLQMDLSSGYAERLGWKTVYDAEPTVKGPYLDKTFQTISFADADNNIKQLNLADQTVTTLSANADHAGSDMEFHGVSRISKYGDNMLITNYTGANRGFYEVNRNTGQRTLEGTHNDIRWAGGVYSDFNHEIVFAGNGKIYNMSLADGTTNLLAETQGTDEIPFENYISDIALLKTDEFEQNRFVMINEEGYRVDLLEFDITTGERQTLTSNTHAGPQLLNIRQLTVSSTHNEFYVWDENFKRMVRVDADTGEKALIGDYRVNTADDFILIDTDDAHLEHLHEKSLVLSTNEDDQNFHLINYRDGTVEQFAYPEDYDTWGYDYPQLDDQNRFIYFANEENITRYNMADATMETMVTQEARITSMWLDTANNRLLITLDELPNIRAMDLTTLEVSVLTTNINPNAVPEFSGFNTATNDLYYYDDDDGGLFVVNLTSDTVQQISPEPAHGQDLDEEEYHQYDFDAGTMTYLANSGQDIIQMDLTDGSLTTLYQGVRQNGSVDENGISFIKFLADENRVIFHQRRSAAIESIQLDTNEHTIVLK